MVKTKEQKLEPRADGVMHWPQYTPFLELMVDPLYLGSTPAARSKLLAKVAKKWRCDNREVTECKRRLVNGRWQVDEKRSLWHAHIIYSSPTGSACVRLKKNQIWNMNMKPFERPVISYNKDTIMRARGQMRANPAEWLVVECNVPDPEQPPELRTARARHLADPPAVPRPVVFERTAKGRRKKKELIAEAKQELKDELRELLVGDALADLRAEVEAEVKAKLEKAHADKLASVNAALANERKKVKELTPAPASRNLRGKGAGKAKARPKGKGKKKGA